MCLILRGLCYDNCIFLISFKAILVFDFFLSFILPHFARDLLFLEEMHQLFDSRWFFVPSDINIVLFKNFSKVFSICSFSLQQSHLLSSLSDFFVNFNQIGKLLFFTLFVFLYFLLQFFDVFDEAFTLDSGPSLSNFLLLLFEFCLFFS